MRVHRDGIGCQRLAVKNCADPSDFSDDFLVNFFCIVTKAECPLRAIIPNFNPERELETGKFECLPTARNGASNRSICTKTGRGSSRPM
jgi:hypothetical protein